jgi:poly-gamma-glutamate capsule biosynthesis protein CapA/YwtB (metallophosphatase superfamily)
MTCRTLCLSVLGQALIQHDLRADSWPDFAELTAVLRRADLCFSDLETAIRNPLAEAPTRGGVLLYAAEPAVLDCLKELSISLLATANNHLWDLGTGGIIAPLPSSMCAALPMPAPASTWPAAAAPVFRRTAKATVALVAAASGAIRDGAAATATRAGVNELRLDGAGISTPADCARILSAIAEAAGQADIVLAYHTTTIFCRRAAGNRRRGSASLHGNASMPAPHSMRATARRGCTVYMSLRRRGSTFPVLVSPNQRLSQKRSASMATASSPSPRRQ